MKADLKEAKIYVDVVNTSYELVIPQAYWNQVPFIVIIYDINVNERHSDVELILFLTTWSCYVGI